MRQRARGLGVDEHLARAVADDAADRRQDLLAEDVLLGELEIALVLEDLQRIEAKDKHGEDQARAAAGPSAARRHRTAAIDARAAEELTRVGKPAHGAAVPSP